MGHVLSPTFYPLRIVLVPLLIPTSSGGKGGALAYSRVKVFLRNALRSGTPPPIVTTLFDLYKLDKNFPEFNEASGRPLDKRLSVLKAAFHKDIVDYTGCQSDHFVPYFQPYEFEALLFSDVSTVTALETGWAAATAELQKVRDAVDSPEQINDGPNTKPAARLAEHLTDPHYNKVLYGSIAAELIGLARIEAECPYFAAWLAALRSFAPSPTS